METKIEITSDLVSKIIGEMTRLNPLIEYQDECPNELLKEIDFDEMGNPIFDDVVDVMFNDMTTDQLVYLATIEPRITAFLDGGFHHESIFWAALQQNPLMIRHFSRTQEMIDYCEGVL